MSPSTRPAAPHRTPDPRTPDPQAPVLVLDTGSPTSSLAIGGGGRCLGQRDFPLRRGSEELLPQLRGLLAASRLSFAELGGVVALQGPGSFTGLRIALATALGFHQALGLPATALGTLPVLAHWGLGAGSLGERSQEVMVAVDAMRGDFYAQLFWRGERPGEVLPVAEAKLYSAAELLLCPGRLVGFGLGELLAKAGVEAPAAKIAPEPPPLAAEAIPLLAGLDWDPARLIQPVYFRPPAVTLPRS